jgi:hypothetical protein
MTAVMRKLGNICRVSDDQAQNRIQDYQTFVVILLLSNFTFLYTEKRISVVFHFEGCCFEVTSQLDPRTYP